MNLNEYFFFKTIKCSNTESHDMNTCYFYHDSNEDQRRKQIDIYYLNNSTESFIPIEKLNIYSNNIGFEDDFLNKELLTLNACNNSFEHKYHILNYKTQICFFHLNGNLECPYQNKCNYIHKNGENNESNLTQDFFLLREFFARTLEDVYFLNIKEVNRLFIDEIALLKITEFFFKENRYLARTQHATQFSEYSQSNQTNQTNKTNQTNQLNQLNEYKQYNQYGQYEGEYPNSNNVFTREIAATNSNDIIGYSIISNLPEQGMTGLIPQDEILLFQQNPEMLYKNIIDEIKNVPVFHKGNNINKQLNNILNLY